MTPPLHSLVKCTSGSPSNCYVKTQPLPDYSPGTLVRVYNGRQVRRSTDSHSCPTGYKIWSPRSKADWSIVYNAMGHSLNNYPRKPSLIVDVTRSGNGCGGCTRYAMKSSVSQQSSWKTTDGSAWWLRDTSYSEPNGDYHANCYLEIKTLNSDGTAVFNDDDCISYSTDYFCQPNRRKWQP